MSDPYFGYTDPDYSGVPGEYQPYYHTDPLPDWTPTTHYGDDAYHSTWDDSYSEDDKNKNSVTDKYAQSAENDTIEKIYQRIMAQDAGQVQALSDQWSKFAMALQNLSDSIINVSQSLQNGSDGGKGWHSPAADEFLKRGPGATAKSITDWQQTAIALSVGLYYLVGTIYEYQAKMDTLWQQYKAAMVKASDKFGGDDDYSQYYGENKKDNPDDYVAYLRAQAEGQGWHRKARDLQWEMAQAYDQVAVNNIIVDTPHTFQGPTNAVIADPKFMMPVPNLGNTPSAPNLPNGPGNTPKLNMNVEPPPTPNVPVPPTPSLPPPALPNTPENMPVGVPEGTPPALPNVNVDNLPGGTPDPSLVVDPALLANPLLNNPALLTNAPGTAPGLPNTGAPNAGGLNNPGLSRGMGGMPPPSTPRLSKGALRRPTMSGQEPGGRAPQTPGTLRNKSGDRPDLNRPLAPGDEEEFGRPGQGATPPVLRGRSAGTRPPTFDERQAGINRTPGATPARPGSGPPVLNRKRQGGAGQLAGPPTGPVDDDVLQPTQPGTSAPILRGFRPTSGPVEDVPPARAVRGTSRPANAGEQQIASRRKARDQERERERERIDREFERIQRLMAEEEAWVVETPGGAVLDNTPERTGYQVEPKPTLGGGSAA